jgi:hypothetical protein
MKIKHVSNEGYFRHLWNATQSAIKSISAGLIIFIHAIVPKLFPNLGTSLLMSTVFSNVKRSANEATHIQIRYNTKNNGGPLKWRVTVDGNETLASHIEIYGYVYGESSLVDDDQKMNIACDGKIYWNGTRAKIVASEKANHGNNHI